MRKLIVLSFLFFTVVSYAASKKKTVNLDLRSPNGAGEAKRLQQEAAYELDIPVEREINLGLNTELKLILIPSGRFYMGSGKSERQRCSDEGPQHLVRITKPFYMGKYELTQIQYEFVVGQNKCKFNGASLPVENINFYEVNKFLGILNSSTKLNFRLPTEAEWEYACRAGTSTVFYFGDTIKSNEANYNATHTYGKGHTGAYLKKTVNVGSYRPNAFGLYDMHGNVWEWCSDIYWNKYYSKSYGNDPQGHDKGKTYVIRGGAWNKHPHRLRSAERAHRGPGADNRCIGFRVVLDVSEEDKHEGPNKSKRPPDLEIVAHNYDEKTKKGYVTAITTGKDINKVTDQMKKFIGKVCSSKNIVIQDGTEPEPGFFRILNENTKDGKCTIEFQAVR